MSATTSRRGFLATAAGASLWSAASYSKILGANERISLGVMGYGLIGKKHVSTFRQLNDVELVGVADCHRGRADEGQGACGGRAVGLTDFRRLLDDSNVNAVIVATPDHWHALATMLACAAGKDVYVEKPLTLFVREGEWMQKVAERTRRIVQVGTQQRSGPHYQAARNLIKEGRIGTISSVRMWNARNVVPGFGSPPDGPPPPDLDWDMWLGPAPRRPYNTNRGLYHFRWFWDTAGGQMTNLGAHHLDIVDWILGLQGLQTVMSVGGRYVLEDNGETPDTQDALFDCGRFSISCMMREAARGERPTNGLTFHGSRGSLGIDREGFRITPDAEVLPQSQIPGIKDGHPVGGPRLEAAQVQGASAHKLRTDPLEDTTGNSDAQYLNHARDFIDCIRSRKAPISDLASAHRTSVACHLANLSLRLGRSLRWDWTTNSIANDPEANGLLVRPYRSPWDQELESLGVN
jgi:predicted dehydrogenase